MGFQPWNSNVMLQFKSATAHTEQVFAILQGGYNIMHTIIYVPGIYFKASLVTSVVQTAVTRLMNTGPAPSASSTAPARPYRAPDTSTCDSIHHIYPVIPASLPWCQFLDASCPRVKYFAFQITPIPGRHMVPRAQHARPRRSWEFGLAHNYCSCLWSQACWRV